MTPQEWINKVKGIAKSIEDNRVLFFATTATMADMSERIWGKGELSDGGKVAYKEDYEVYIYKPPFPRAPDGRGKTGRKIKGQWAPTYLAAKASQDRGDLPFELTGDLRIDWAGGAVPEPDEVTPTLCVIRLNDVNAKKADGLAKEKGEFLRLTAGEIKQHTTNIQLAYRELVIDRL